MALASYRRAVELLNYMNEVFKRLALGTALDTLIQATNAGLNTILNSAGVAIATTASKVKTTVALNYLVNGVWYTKAITDNFWTLTGPNLADGNSRKYLLLIDASGAASVVYTNDLLTAQAAKLTYPNVPAGRCVVGVLQVDTSGAAFVPGTTLLSAGTVTDTYTDGAPAGLAYEGPTPLLTP